MKRILLALSFGIIATLGLFALVFVVDALNTVGEGMLVNRTPFAWTFFWSYKFLPAYVNFGVVFLTAFLSNIILYSVMNYVVKERKIRLV